jgi:hypothetical protein
MVASMHHAAPSSCSSWASPRSAHTSIWRGDAFLELTDLLIGFGEKVASVHRHRSLPHSSSAFRFTAGAAGFLNLSQSLAWPER